MVITPLKRQKKIVVNQLDSAGNITTPRNRTSMENTVPRKLMDSALGKQKWKASQKKIPMLKVPGTKDKMPSAHKRETPQNRIKRLMTKKRKTIM